MTTTIKPAKREKALRLARINATLNPNKIAQQATPAERHRATVLLAQIVAPGTTEESVFTALDRALKLTERIAKR